MWTTGAVDMWITVGAKPLPGPRAVLTPPGDHPGAGMRLSRRPGAARLRHAGQRNGAADGQDRTGRPQISPPGCAHEPRPGPAAQPGYCRLPDRPSRCQATRSRVFTTRLTTAPETQRPSPLPGKRPELRQLVAGAGLNLRPLGYEQNARNPGSLSLSPDIALDLGRGRVSPSLTLYCAVSSGLGHDHGHATRPPPQENAAAAASPERQRGYEPGTARTFTRRISAPVTLLMLTIVGADRAVLARRRKAV